MNLVWDQCLTCGRGKITIVDANYRNPDGDSICEWKSESAKKCVITYLPNARALKMDGAEAKNLYLTNNASTVHY